MDIVEAIEQLTSNLGGEKGHLILTDAYSGNDNFKAVVILVGGTISYEDSISRNTATDITVVNKDVIYGNLTNVTLGSGTTAIGYYA